MAPLHRRKWIFKRPAKRSEGGRIDIITFLSRAWAHWRQCLLPGVDRSTSRFLGCAPNATLVAKRISIFLQPAQIGDNPSQREAVYPRSSGPSEAHNRALDRLSSAVRKQAEALSYIDGFAVVALAACAAFVVIAILLGRGPIIPLYRGGEYSLSPCR
jgi:hypothetical protein